MISSNKIIRTQECTRFGHTEFRLIFDSAQVIEPDTKWLAEFLTRNVAAGIQYKPSELIQIGCMVLKIQTNDEGTLSLFEPDFIEMPIRFVDSVTQTLMQLRLQKSMAESIGFEEAMAFPSLIQSCLICTRVKDRGDFMMERFDASQNDSGWYLGCLEADHDHNDPQNLRRVSLYDVVCGRLTCIIFLPLPSKTRVKVMSNNFTITSNGRAVIPKANSFLQRYMQTNSSGRPT